MRHIQPDSHSMLQLFHSLGLCILVGSVAVMPTAWAVGGRESNLSKVSHLNQLIEQIQVHLKRKSKTTEMSIAIEMQIESSEQQLKILRNEIARQKISLKNRIRSRVKRDLLYRLNIPDLRENWAMTELASKVTGAVTRNVEKSVNKLSLQEQSLLAQMTELEQQKEKARKIRETLEQQDFRLDQSLAEQSQLQRHLYQRFREGELQGLAENDLLAITNFPKSVFAKLGQLPLPLREGKPVEKFGTLVSKNPRYWLSHPGLFIASPLKAAVHAVHDGIVAFQGSIQGLGQTLIVDHGGHLASVYTYLGETLVHEGEKISSQQVLGIAGFSDTHERSGIYFELRYFAEPVNPKIWLKKSVAL